MEGKAPGQKKKPRRRIGKRSVRPSGGSDLYHRLEQVAPIKQKMVSLDLLKCVLPCGAAVKWAGLPSLTHPAPAPASSPASASASACGNVKPSASASASASACPSKPVPFKNTLLPFNKVHEWLAPVDKREPRASILEVNNIDKVIGHNHSIVGTHTSFLLKCIVN